MFLLREVFGYDYAEVARIVGKSEQNCRQIFARARQHIGDRRPRFESSRAQGEELARRFFVAAAGGEMDALLTWPAPRRWRPPPQGAQPLVLGGGAAAADEGARR